MIPFPALTAWSLVAAAAVAAAAPPSLWWLALFPLAVAALGLLQRFPAERPPLEHVDLRVYLDIGAGSMCLDHGREPGEPWRAQAPSEAAWHTRYQVPPLEVSGWISGAGGADVIEGTPPGWADARQLERLERLASTSEMRAVR